MTVYEGLRAAYSAIGSPVETDADIGIIENALSLAGFKLDVDAGRLVAFKDNVMVPIEPALKTLSLRPDMQSNFVLPLDRVTKASQLKTAERKAAYIQKFGLSRWQELVGAKK